MLEFYRMPRAAGGDLGAVRITTMRCSLVSDQDQVAVLVTVTKAFATEYTFKTTD